MNSPIVIIGAARSGTKFLRDVLSASFATRAVPYDVNYVWRFGAGKAVGDRLDPESLTETQRRFIRQTLSKLAGAGKDDRHRLIEKTVSNTLRVPYVHQVLPEAQFIHLIRDGRDVTESAIRQWQRPPDWKALMSKLQRLPLRNAGYALWFARNAVAGLLAGRRGGKIWGPRYPGIDEDVQQRDLVEVCALQWLHSFKMAERDLARLPPEKIIEIRYEELIASEGVLERLASHLKLQCYEDILAAYRSRLRTPEVQPWQKLTADQQSRMLAILEPTLVRLGYM